MSLEVDEVLYFMARLHISGVAIGDAGEYKAIAKNTHGTCQATINLNFDTSSDKPK